MKKWKCTVCGYIHNGSEPPNKCPICGADKSKFILIEGDIPLQPISQPATKKEKAAGKVRGRWRCTICGYMQKSDEPPDKCPVCESDKDRFVQLDHAPVVTPPAFEPPDGPAREKPRADRGKTISDSVHHPYLKRRPLTKWFTRLHAHPIAVHIPNGVLPVTVIFTFLALIFKSEGFALAARCNMVFVSLFMPVVILTGVVDWQNRFEGRMSQVFGAKMVCAAIVLVLSLVLVIWGVFQTRVYLGQTSMPWLFVLINLADLAAAGVAGWYGGKLVFPDSQ